MDSFQHLHGPRSPEAYWALEYVDGLIGRFLDSLPDPGLDQTTVFVVSDHGFLPSHREIRPNVRLRKLGAQREARFVMNHGAGALYRLDGDLAAVHQLAREIAAMEGVSGMWTAAEYGALGLPTPGEHSQVADVMFEAAPGYSYGDAAEGDEEHGAPKYLGTHGQRPTLRATTRPSSWPPARASAATSPWARSRAATWRRPWRPSWASGWRPSRAPSWVGCSHRRDFGRPRRARKC